MITSADWQLILERTGRLVREALVQARDGGIAGPTFRPGVVGDEGDGSTLGVRADGDVNAISAVNATGSFIPGGSRVQLMFLPPHGVFVTGVLAGGMHWIPYSSTPIPTGGAFTTVTGIGAFARRDRHTIDWRFRATITAVGTGTGDVIFSLPYPPVAAQSTFGSGRENGVTGNPLAVYSAGGSLVAVGGAGAPGDGYVYDVNGSYETTL